MGCIVPEVTKIWTRLSDFHLLILLLAKFLLSCFLYLWKRYATNKDRQYSTRTYCIAHVMWQPGWEGSLRESGYMYMYGWVPLLFTWNHHNTVNQLQSMGSHRVRHDWSDLAAAAALKIWQLIRPLFSWHLLYYIKKIQLVTHKTI